MNTFDYIISDKISIIDKIQHSVNLSKPIINELYNDPTTLFLSVNEKIDNDQSIYDYAYIIAHFGLCAINAIMESYSYYKDKDGNYSFEGKYTVKPSFRNGKDTSYIEINMTDNALRYRNFMKIDLSLVPDETKMCRDLYT